MKRTKIKNPLNKRIRRELKQDVGKYLALFLFLTLTIGFVSGFLVAGGSMKGAYDDSFEKYTLEDGHITLDKPMPEEMRSLFEQKGDMKLYDNFYLDVESSANDSVVRIFCQEEAPSSSAASYRSGEMSLVPALRMTKLKPVACHTSMSTTMKMA